MTVYTELEKLKNANLNRGDIIEFPGYKYIVSPNALLYYLNDLNDTIFVVLNIPDKYGFCSEHYKYPAKGSIIVPGQFPLSALDDFEALKRVSIAIWELCLS